MISQPLVSIIIPCYNAEEYIEACINSVILQDYENWECIIINDGSKDNTLNIIKIFEAASHKITVFAQENTGLSATRNKGIEHSKGVFIFFLDSDDVLDSHAITTLVSAVSDNDIVTGITVNSKIGNKHIEKISHLYPPKEGNVVYENNHFEVLIKALESALTPVAQNRLYKKDFINKNNLRFKEKILHEDELWFFETMLLARNVKFIDQETYFYRTDNQDSITKNVGDRNLESYITIMEVIFEKYSKHLEFKVIASWYMVYIKKIFLDFATRERNKLSDKIIDRLEAALKNCYISLGNEKILSKNNDIYYRTINILSLKSYSIIQKNFFRNPINSLRKVYKVFKIKYLLR
jgi:glycosyltransferase involved in cell wall biosynthesis